MIKKQISINFFFLMIVQFLNYFSSFLLLPYLARVLSVEHYGVIFLSISFSNYFLILCDYGFNISGVRNLAQRKENSVSRLLSLITYIRGALFVVSLLIAVIMIFCISSLRQYWGIYFLSICSIINSVFFPIWLFQGIEKMHYITMISVTSKIVYVVLVILIIGHDSQFYLIPVFNFISIVSACVCAQYIILFKLKVKYTLIKLSELKAQLIEGWYLFLMNISAMLYGSSNTFLLGLLTNPKNAAIYGAAEKIISIVITVIGVFAQSVFPSIAKLASENKDTYVTQLKKNLLLFIILGLIFFISICFGSKYIIEIMFGHKYHESILVLQIMSIIPLVACINNVFSLQGLVVCGYNKELARITLFIGLLNIVLMFYLVPKLNYIGSAISVASVEILMPILALFILYRKGIKVF